MDSHKPDSDSLYQSFNRKVQQLQLEACLAVQSYDPKVERVFREVSQLMTSEELQRRMREKRGCA